jgi:acetylornithine/succinyldiaminopimelate/putrescine aminotransferase
MSEIGIGARLPVDLVRGEGAFVFDAEGTRYLDAYASQGQALLGHGHEAVGAAMSAQGSLISANGRSALRASALERLCALGPQNLQRALFVNSADEANETALKIARQFRDRRKMIAFRGGYHGRTYGANSVTGLRPYDRQHPDSVPGTIFCRWGDLRQIRDVLGGDVAGVIVEPVQLLQGGRTANSEFLVELEQLCRARAGALIVDETRGGPARCGATLASVLQGVQPHIVTLGPSIASGIPCGALLIDRGMSEIIVGPELDAASAGGPFVSAVCEATLRVAADEDLAGRAKTLGDLLASKLDGQPGVAAVRGLGLLRAVALEGQAEPVAERLRQEFKILCGTCTDPRVILLAPPLVIDEETVESLASAVARAAAS